MRTAELLGRAAELEERAWHAGLAAQRDSLLRDAAELRVQAANAQLDDEALAGDVAVLQAVPVVPSILETVCRTTGLGFAAVARVTDERWIACGVNDLIDFGLKPGGELEITSTICNEIRGRQEPVIIEHVAEDPVYRGHHTPAIYGFQSYASFPIKLPDGRFFGTLCAIDLKPARLDTPEVRSMFVLFAELIGFYIDAHERMAASAKDLAISAASLADERRTAELREQFIAVLGHDLRNPLASVEAGVELLAKAPRDAREHAILGMMRASTRRMSGLIDNVLDLARGRLGGGLALAREPCELAQVLRHLADEMIASHPGRWVEVEIDLPAAIDCDRTRLSQLVSNLLGNALTHGAADQPVRLEAYVEQGVLTILVSNGGPPIPAEALPRLFQPFERGALRPNLQGLGLGLYIASEIARSHGGVLAAVSTAERTTFTFQMPLA